MNQIPTLLTERFGLFRTWGSFARVAGWVVVWCVVIGLILSPAGPNIDDRDHAADTPASNVRYLSPTSRQDFGGFLAPHDTDPNDEQFTVAWIGGSEVKLDAVSVAGEVSNRIASFGDRTVQIDGYTLIAPRPIDVLRAIDSAVANDSDAIVISINAIWLTDEWSMRSWPNLDVANLGTLWRWPRSWPWALSLTSPAEVAWRVSRAASPVVGAQNRLNERALEIVDALDLTSQPTEAAAPEDPDPRLPTDPTTFWLVQEYGPSVMDDTTQRVAIMVEGLDVDSPVADSFNLRILEQVQSAGVPTLMYVAPFAPAAMADPTFAAAAQQVEAYWTRLANTNTSPIVEIEPTPMTAEFAESAAFNDVVHMRDAGPFADVIVPRLCANWRTAHPTWECS